MAACRRFFLAILVAAAVVRPAVAQRVADGMFSGAIALTQPLTSGLPGDVAAYVTIDPSQRAFGPWASAGFRLGGLLARDAQPIANVGVRFRRRSLKVALGISRDVAYGNLGRSDASPDQAAPSAILDSLLGTRRPIVVVDGGLTSNAGNGDSGRAASRAVYTTQAVTDFISTVEWNAGHVTLGAETGWRLSGPNGRRPWYGATLAVPVVPTFALVAGVDRRYERVVSPGRVRMTLGIQWRSVPWAHGAAKRPRQSGAERGDSTRRVAPSRGNAVTAARVPNGVRLTWSMPTAARVEVRSDVTGWNAVPMVRTADGTWQLDLVTPPGVHRLTLRVDDGAWVVPPGLPVGSDGYGAVGLLVVEP